MLDPIIKVENLTKNYGDFEAVKGLSFEVYPGEIFGLLGPNGAGKSTTLEIIETLRQKTSGKVMVNGFDIEKDADEIKKIIGVQLQTAGFYPGHAGTPGTPAPAQGTACPRTFHPGCGKCGRSPWH
jgi:ABC-2 type transport system ATP-binding protein